MNTPSLSLKASGSHGEVPESPPIIRMEFAPIGSPERCPFSVEVAPTNSNSFDHLQLSTISKSWSLAMKTTNSNLLDKSENEDRGDETIVDDDEFPLNEIERALSKEQAPVGLVRISSDSESSSRDESVDIDSEDEDDSPASHSPTTPRGHQCALSPRLSTTPARGNHPNKPKSTQGSSAPLDKLKVLNPGVPQGHANHRHHRRQTSYSSIPGNPRTPKRGDSNALVSTNSNVASTSATDCMCFAIEDVAAFFCPVTPRSATIDTTTQCPTEVDCFPAYDYGATPSPSGEFGSSFPSIAEFWASPNNSPLPRSREEQFEALFLLNSNLPRNRGHSQRKKHVKKLLVVWHGAEDRDTELFENRDDFHLLDKRQRRRRLKLTQPMVCYDSDPEQEVLGRWKRRSTLLAKKNRNPRNIKSDLDDDEPQLLDEDDLQGKQQPRFRRHRPEPFTHLDTDVESSSEDDDSSYETAKCVSPPPSHPVAPRNSDPKISFDFGKNLSPVNVDGESDCENGSLRQESKQDDQNGSRLHPRELCSVTSSSTTGHSRYHTIRTSPADSCESSLAGFSSISEPTRSQKSFIGAGNQRHALPSYFKSYPTHWTEFQLLFSRNVDEESIKSHVHEVSNVRFPLVWHPGANPPAPSSNAKKTDGKMSANKATKTRSPHHPTSDKIASLSSNSSSEKKTNKRKGTPFPISVGGAFEVGAHLEHMVVQPKFTWMPLAQPHRTEDKGANHREVFLNGSAPPQVELLSIIRVAKAGSKSLDRTLYPYARLDRTCIVSTNDANHPTIVLEARSPQERDWLVFSLKLIVARLASIIITRDEDMLHEFFSPYSALMQLEDQEEEESASESLCAEKPPVSPKSTKSETLRIDCESTPTATYSKAVMMMNEEGPGEYVFPQGMETDGDISVNDCTTDSCIDDLGDLDTDDEDDDDDCYQNRDDLENEDSIRARNAGAYAILKRSLSATAPLNDHQPDFHQEDNMLRTFSY